MSCVVALSHNVVAQQHQLSISLNKTAKTGFLFEISLWDLLIFGTAIFWVTLSAVVCASWAESLSAPSNEIDTPTVRIDPILRKALLKALSNLEREELEDENTTPESSTQQSEELLEESTSSDRKLPLVQYHTYIIDRNSSTGGDDGDTIFQTIILPKTTLSPPKQDKHEKKKIIFSVPDPVKDSDIKIETVQLARSVTTSVQANEIVDDRQSGKTTPSKDLLKSTSTTSLPSTTVVVTTTPEPPVTNEDGENIEKVREVQIHQAPLVAAFTVQQDEQGLPKRVVPIFKHSEPQSATTVQSVPAIQSLSQPPSIQPTPNTYQQALENKQRELEEKIQFLQAQQRQQEHLIRQHQIYQEQQSLQRQQQLLLEQRLRLEEQRIRQQRYEQEQRLFRLSQRPPIPLNRPPNDVQLFSSLSLTPPNGILLEQQLPVKEAINFRNSPHIFSQPPHLSASLQAPHRPFSNFHPNGPPSFSAPPSPDRNRVFRHDSETGNFGFNTNNPNNNFQQQQQQLRQLTPSHQANQQLQNLLYQSGISGGRSQEEDLNIITRVLALNHGITTPLNGFPNGRQQNFV
ncbi:myb-like protein Q [Phlebotomus argentipes]|uniref:myb-like protein Q n=1 Tax=Phlebotomus argentipes TaxID=94469 RepID=UPI0028929B78|nr:myb-like protein Q [Phlebotomus argentipes]